jgi:hypothetical protein
VREPRRVRYASAPAGTIADTAGNSDSVSPARTGQRRAPRDVLDFLPYNALALLVRARPPVRDSLGVYSKAGIGARCVRQRGLFVFTRALEIPDEERAGPVPAAKGAGTIASSTGNSARVERRVSAAASLAQ